MILTSFFINKSFCLINIKVSIRLLLNGNIKLSIILKTKNSTWADVHVPIYTGVCMAYLHWLCWWWQWSNADWYWWGTCNSKLVSTQFKLRKMIYQLLNWLIDWLVFKTHINWEVKWHYYIFIMYINFRQKRTF